MTRVEALLEEALTLPPKERARLVEELSQSLDDADVGDNLDDATGALLDARIDNMVAHPERGLPLEDAMASIRAEFERRKRP